jgi:hypothetical protein
MQRSRVAFGLLVPIKPVFSGREGLPSASISSFRPVKASGAEVRSMEDRNAALRDLEELARESQPPLDRLHHAPSLTSYVIVPISRWRTPGSC